MSSETRNNKPTENHQHIRRFANDQPTENHQQRAKMVGRAVLRLGNQYGKFEGEELSPNRSPRMFIYILKVIIHSTFSTSIKIADMRNNSIQKTPDFTSADPRKRYLHGIYNRCGQSAWKEFSCWTDYKDQRR